ncbi:MAG: hypothetical protein HQ506_07105 [Candidatus Marinimicrobia bacterium]|nr:hypothetical protein [Candidatus Neomarinimicrobiota bacterium]
MKYIKSFTVLTILIFIAACGSGSNPGVNPESLQAGPKPNWLIQHPVDPTYYLGIGSASKNQYGSEAVADLEGHELVDTWQDATYHFAYYRLSKAQYAAIQARKRQAALSLSTDFLAKANAAIALNQFSDAFNGLVQAFIPLLPYLNEALEINIEGRQVILSNEIHSRLQSLLSGIELAPSKSELSVKLGQPITEELAVFAKGYSGQPMRGLPLKVHFSRGAGEVVGLVSTDPQGVARLQVASISAPLKLQILEISVAVEQLIPGESPVLSAIIASIPPTSTRIVLDVNNPSIYLVSNESFDGKLLKQLQVDPRLKNHFIGEGFNFVDTQKEADWQMTLRATATKGTEYSGMYTTFADVSLSVVDRNTGKEIYTNSLARVKGIDLSYENAAKKALNNAADQMVNNILPQILESIK